MTTQYRSRFGSPDAPLWGTSFDTLRLYNAKAEYDEELPSMHSVFSANADDDVTEIVNDFIQMKGIGKQGARDLLAKLGMLLNEIEEANNGR